MTTDRILQKYETFTNLLVDKFIIKYFEVEDSLDVDMYWVADDVGSVCMINDYFFDMSDIRFCLMNGVEVNKLFEWYHYILENPEVYINLKSHIRGVQEILKSRIENPT